MKFFSSAGELIESEMPRSTRIKIYPFFESGLQAYRDILKTNELFFNSAFATNIKGHLLNYMIFRQFEPDMISQQFLLKAEARRVNNFYYNSLNLLKDGLIINVGKTYGRDKLPNRSRYRKKYCRLNKFREKHLFFDINSENELVQKNEPYFMLLTYGLDRGEIEYVNLMVPNDLMTGYHKSIDLKAECLYEQPELLHNEEMEKRMTALKTDTIQKLKLLKGEES
jgi:hypothetical protein